MRVASGFLALLPELTSALAVVNELHSHVTRTSPVHSQFLLQRGAARLGRLAPWPSPAPPAVSSLLPAERPAWPTPSPAPPAAEAATPTPAPAPAAPAPNVKLARAQPPQAAAPAAASGDAEEVDVGLDRVCVRPADVKDSLKESMAAVVKGLPPWPQEAKGPAEVDSPVLAYLIQASFAPQLALMARVFTRIYTPRDVFLYLVDSKMLDPNLVRAALPSPLPENVAVRRARHAGYYYWPRVQVLLDAMAKLLEQQWDFVIHLSESDYPVHSVNWLRRTLSKQRQRSFMTLVPRCTTDVPERPSGGGWYWWTQNQAVASCESYFEPVEVPGASFPTEALERHGVRFARAPEWMILTRELVQYASRPSLRHFKRLIGMHAASDEIFWATLALNIPGFTQSIGHQVWYIHWNPLAPGHSPETLTGRHLPQILQDRQRYLFVRKVNETHSGELLDQLDRLIQQPEADFPGLEGPKDAAPAWDHGAVACRPGAGEGEGQPLASDSRDAAEPGETVDCASPLCM